MGKDQKNLMSSLMGLLQSAGGRETDVKNPILNAQQLVSKVTQNYELARNFRQDLSLKWRRYINLYKGNHWSKTMPTWKSKSIQNMCYAFVEQTIPLMTDKMPSIIVNATNDSDVDMARQVQMLMQSNWNRDSMQYKVVPLIRDMLILGTGILKVTFDPDKLNGAGDIETHVIDPFDVFVDPYATDPMHLEWMVYRTFVPLRKLKLQYPDVADKLMTDNQFQALDDVRNVNGKTKDRGGNICTVLECWHYDDQGKVHVTTTCNGVLLDDKETPFEYEGFPFVFFYYQKLNGQFYGISMYDNLESLQMDMNKNRAVIMDNLIATQNTVWVVDKTAGIKKHAITNEPGLILEKNPAGKVERMPPAPLQSYVQQQLQSTQQSMEDVSGVKDLTHGMFGSSHTSASAISIITEQAQIRIRGILRNLEEGIIKTSKIWYSIMRSMYKEPRIIRLIGKEDSFIQFDARNLRSPSTLPQHLNEDGSPQTDENGQPIYEMLTEFDFSIAAGSTMLMNKSARFQQYFEMFMRGALDIETLLESAEMEKPVEEVIENLIKYGQIKDPNQPQVNPQQVLEGLGLKFNMTSNDPTMILTALQNVNQQAQQMSAQVAQDAGMGQAQPPQPGGPAPGGAPNPQQAGPEGGMQQSLELTPPNLRQAHMMGQAYMDQAQSQQFAPQHP